MENYPFQKEVGVVAQNLVFFAVKKKGTFQSRFSITKFDQIAFVFSIAVFYN